MNKNTCSLSEEMKNLKEEVKDDMTNLREEMNKNTCSLREEMKNLKEEVKDDMKSLKEEVKDDMKNLREDMKNLREEVYKDINKLDSQVQGLSDNIESLQIQVEENRKGWASKMMLAMTVVATIGSVMFNYLIRFFFLALNNT